MNYSIIYSKRRSIALAVNQNAEVVVRASPRHPKYLIQKFVEHHKDWVQKRIEARQKTKKQFVDGELFLYLGKEYPLRTMRPYHRNKLEFENGQFNACVTSAISVPKMGILFIEWYKKQAKDVLLERLQNYSRLMNLKYKRMAIRNASTRWGSCSSVGNINFSYKLIMAPLEIIDYVVIHELAHLQHQNHSANFWSLVEQYYPSYKQARAWLRTNGGKLMV